MLKPRSPQTIHQEFWEHNNCAYVYAYDPTDDGPECGLIKGIQASHSEFDLREERADFQYTAWIIGRIVCSIRGSKVPPVILDTARASEFADRIRLRGVEL